MTADGLANTIASPSGTQYAHTPIAVSLQTIINGENIKRTDLADTYELGFLLLLGLILIIASRFVHYYIVAGTIVLAGVGTVFGATYLYSTYLLLFDFSWPVITIMIVGLHAVFNRFVREFQLKQQIRKQFEKYLDPRQVAILVKHPEKLKLGGDRKEMSFLGGLRVLGSWSWGLGICFRHFRNANNRFEAWEGFQRLHIAISIHTVVLMGRNLRSGTVSE